MPIYALGSQVPTIDGTAYIHPEAVLIGSVTVGPQSSIWPGAVLRADDGEILIGARTSIQDNSVLHTTPVWSTRVGDECTIGHIVHLEGCNVEHNSLIGNGAVVLHNVTVSTGSIVAANSVVLNDTFVPPGALAVGSPAVIKEGRARREVIEIAWPSYVRRTERYARELRRLD